jgi:predicted nucleotidyltransferase
MREKRSILKGVLSMSRIYSVAELQDILSPVFLEHGVKSATLFGSYAKGTPSPCSDVDLVVDSGLRGLAFFGLLESVSTALEAPVDLIDISQIDKGSLVDHEIAQSGVRIYG